MPIPFAQLSEDLRRYIKGGADRGGEDIPSDVRPSLPLPYSADLRRSDAVVCSDGGIDAGILSDRQNLCGREFENPVGDAPCAPAFGNHIECIVRYRAHKQMLNIDTGSDIALVANNEAIRDGAALKYPRKAMDPVPLPLPFEVAVPSRWVLNVTRPKHAALFIGRTSARSKNLLQCPMARGVISRTFGFSHISTSHAVVGQGRSRRSSAARPAHFSTTAAG